MGACIFCKIVAKERFGDWVYQDETLVRHMQLIAHQIGEQQGIAQHAFRLTVHTGGHGGQVVEHLHLHPLGGERMRNPIS